MTDSSQISGFKARLPNILTIGRILLIPVLIVGILKLGNAWQNNLGLMASVLGLFILVCATDFFDGFLARRWNVISDFGRMIDPIADKLLVAGCLIAISIVVNGHWIILGPALAIIARDILVSGAREHAALKSRAMPPTQLAKWKTAAEMLSISVLIYWIGSGGLSSQSNVFLEGTSGYIGAGILWIAALLSVYTGSLYLRAALKD